VKRKPKIFVGCGTVAPGNGGISGVSRMMIRALKEAGAEVRASSLLDHETHVIDGVRVKPAGGSRIAFAADVYRSALTSDHMIYDHIGLARANPSLPFFKKSYSVWIHGIEVWCDLPERRLAIIRNAECVLVNSDYTLRRFEQTHIPLPNARVCLLASEAPEGKAPLADSRDNPTAAILSRITQDGFMKGHLQLIEAWPTVVASVEDARLLIGGGGNALEELREIAARSPAAANVDVLGRIDGTALEDFWRQADVFVMPSRVEGFGLVYTEAMQRSIPVIASVHDAGNQVNADGVTGFNVNLDNPAELSDALIKLLEDRRLRKKMGAAALQRWNDHFTYPAFRDRLTSILEEMRIL